MAFVLAASSTAHADDDVPAQPKPVLVHGAYAVDLSGYVQADLVPWSERSQDQLDPATRDPLNEERFSIRRGRVMISAHRTDGVFANLELDASTVTGTPSARIVGAQVGWHYKELVRLEAGLFLIPFGAANPTFEADVPFINGPLMVRAFFPGEFDGGAMASGAYGIARWAVAMTNGSPSGDAQWKGADPTGQHELVGRLGADIPLPYFWRVTAGISALTGQGLYPGSPSTKDQLVWIDDNGDGQIENSELHVIPGRVAQPAETYARHALGADLAVHWCLCALGKGTATFEIIAGTNLDRGIVYADPIAAGGHTYRELGYAIGAVQDVGKYAQLGARYDHYDADRDAYTNLGADAITTHQRYATLAVFAAGRLGTGARLMIEYDRNTNPNGRADDGSPITRRDDRITARAQVRF